MSKRPGRCKSGLDPWPGMDVSNFLHSLSRPFSSLADVHALQHPLGPVLDSQKKRGVASAETRPSRSAPGYPPDLVISHMSSPTHTRCRRAAVWALLLAGLFLPV